MKKVKCSVKKTCMSKSGGHSKALKRPGQMMKHGGPKRSKFFGGT
jgi:hypothetical protein